MITINPGTSVITANQAASGIYSSGSVDTTLTINQNTIETPAGITSTFELTYFLDTTAEYGNIKNSIVINDNLISLTNKILFSTSNVILIKN